LKNFYRSPFSKWPPQYHSNSTLSDFKWRPVEIVQCQESIRDIIIYPHSKLLWYVGRLWCPELSVEFFRYCGWHFENIAKIQHCPILSQFDMWVDNDVKNWVPTLNNFFWSPNCDGIGQCWVFAILWWPFWKWRLLENFQCWESIHDIIIYPDIKFWRYYRKNSTLSDIIKIWYVGR
jgi:hypothetical protein